MNTMTAEEKNFEIFSELPEKQYKFADDKEVLKISQYLIEKHKEAYIALANV